MGGVTVTALGLRFDRVAVRVPDRLQRGADAGPHPGASVALTLTAPVRAPGKTAGALQQAMNVLLRTGRPGDGRRSNYTGTGPSCVSSRACRRGGLACSASCTTPTSMGRRSWPLRNGGYAAAGRCRLVGARLMSGRGAEVLKSLGTRADKARGFQLVCDHAPDMLIASTSPRSRRARRSSLPDDFIARLLIGPFASRLQLVGAMLASALCGLMLAVLPTLPAASSRVILSWDAGCLWFVVASLLAMSGKDGSDIRARSAEQDDGRGKILGVVLLATAASLAASGVELSLAKSDHGDWKTLRVCLAFLTVTAWRRKPPTSASTRAPCEGSARSIACWPTPSTRWWSP